MRVGWCGAGIAAVGLGSSIKSSSDASKEAKAGRRQAGEAGDAQLAFEQEQYDDWQATYGGIEENLSEYYNSISAETYMAQGLENQQQAFETSMTRINESLAQRGIEPGSGISASIGAQAELGSAEERAKIRFDAPRQATEDKSNFLQIGLGQNPGSSMSSTLSQQSQQLQSQANIAEQRSGMANQQTGQAAQSFVTTAGTALADYYDKNKTPAYDPDGRNYSPVTPIKQPWEK